MSDQQGGPDWVYASDGKWYPRSAYGQKPAVRYGGLAPWKVIVFCAVLGSIGAFLAVTLAGPVADGFTRGVHEGWNEHQTTTTKP